MFTDPAEIDRLLAGTTLEPLLFMWRERAASGLPAWSDFDIIELRQWIGRLTLVDMLPEDKDIRWRVFGTQIAELLQRDMTGFKYSERPEWVGESVYNSYWEVVSVGRPILHIHNDHDGADRITGLVRLMLPMAAISGGDVVSMIATAYASVEESGVFSNRDLAKTANGTG